MFSDLFQKWSASPYEPRIFIIFVLITIALFYLKREIDKLKKDMDELKKTKNKKIK